MIYLLLSSIETGPPPSVLLLATQVACLLLKLAPLTSIPPNVSHSLIRFIRQGESRPGQGQGPKVSKGQGLQEEAKSEAKNSELKIRSQSGPRRKKEEHLNREGGQGHLPISPKAQLEH